MESQIKTVAVVGLGYVGLPLAIHLSKHFSVIGFDVNEKRISELKEGTDLSGESSREELMAARIKFVTDPAALKEAEFIVVCVPTPIDKHKKPDLSCLESASKIVGENLSEGAVVVYESTVYPGVTEEVCTPILEKHSHLKCGIDFKVGYSPERMNPGDKEHTIDKITKVVSGMDQESLQVIDFVYGKVTQTHCAPSIKVAEAAKVIENIQRDLNIALMNELATIFDKMKVDVEAVLEAAGTKWNFHNYRPGLVGGHCIGVDPYYLTYKAEGVGHHPEIVLAGRRINDKMHQFYARKIMQRLSGKKGNNVLLLGLTFKPNVSDHRNSRVKHLIEELQEFNLHVFAYDPYLEKSVVENKFGANWLEPRGNLSVIDLVVLVVEHDQLLQLIQQDIFLNKELISLKNCY